MEVLAPVAVGRKQLVDDLIELPDIGQDIEDGVPRADHLGLEMGLAEAIHVDADLIGVRGATDCVEAFGGFLRAHELAFDARSHRRPDALDVLDTLAQLVPLEVLEDGVSHGLVRDGRDEKGANAFFDLFVRLRGGDDRLHVEGIHIDLQGLFPDGQGGDGSDADLHAV